MGAAEQLEANRMEADVILHMLASDGRVTFQTFDDNSAGKDRKLSRILHGSLAEHAHTLAGLNARGAGVYFMVNEGDTQGRAASNVQRVRALFVDLDGSPLDPVRSAVLPAHVIVESSPGRWHAYWRVTDCPLASFKAVQQALAARFSGDAKVCDLPRVMRLPGFDHRKRAPYRARIVSTNDHRPYQLAELVEAFGLESSPSETAPATTVQKPRRALPATIPTGERNHTLLSLAAGFVRKGFAVRAVTSRLQRINAERCQPPLCAREVEGIAARAVAYGSKGYTMLSHELQDSPEWKELPPAARDVILAAFRRFDGSNNGRIALIWEDLASMAGFARKDTFYATRQRAVDSGILVLTCAGSNTQAGRKPDLFAIADRWLAGAQSRICNPAPVTDLYTVT